MDKIGRKQTKQLKQFLGVKQFRYVIFQSRHTVRNIGLYKIIVNALQKSKDRLKLDDQICTYISKWKSVSLRPHGAFVKVMFQSHKLVNLQFFNISHFFRKFLSFSSICDQLFVLSFCDDERSNSTSLRVGYNFKTIFHDNFFIIYYK